ncbi:MAG: hypothetical protein ACP5RH_01875 [Leptodesmis sp.]
MLFLNAVRKRCWRPVVGLRSNRTLKDGRCLKDLYRHAKRGLQDANVGPLRAFSKPLNISLVCIVLAKEASWGFIVG